jgi:protein TonB
MFDLIAGKAEHIPSHPAAPIMISTAIQLTTLGVIAAVSLVVVTQQAPEIRTMMAFVATEPPPAPPPPPPPARPPESHPAAAATKPVPTTGAFVAPAEVPPRVEPEAAAAYDDEGFVAGVEGGVPGGVPAGIVGGLLVGDVPVTPPSTPTAVAHGPVRVGGEIKAPALLVRVEPIYPAFALAANVQGTVILEATVDEDGRVLDLRPVSGQPLLEKAAITAVRQWRYSALQLNGRPTPFILTVVLSFNLQQR